MACKGILRYTVQIPAEFTEGKETMIRKVVACRLEKCPKTRYKYKNTKRAGGEKDE